MEIYKNLQDIKNLISTNKINIVLVKAKACGVCEAVLAKLEELLKDFPKVNAASVYADEVPSISGEYLVFTAPTVLVFFEGKEICRESRFVRFESLRDVLGLYSTI